MLNQGGVKDKRIHLLTVLSLTALLGMSQRICVTDSLRHDNPAEGIDLHLENGIDSLFLDSSLFHSFEKSPYLEEEDFVRVAEELGVEVAAIKAVIEVEAGRSLSGLTPDGEPIVNYSARTFLKKAAKRGVNLLKAKKEHPKAFTNPSRSSSENFARLSEAMAVDTVAAVESDFWGMFQIGGFNYKKCGAETHSEFARRMSASEHEQLELFAQFLKHGGMVDAIRNRNWRKFASIYNGPSYAARGYHRRLAAAYAKYKKN